MKLLSLTFGDKEFRKELGQSRDRLYRLAYSWSHDPALADDLTQETMAKALKNAGSLRDPGAMKPWLVKILLNCWREHFRRRKDSIDIDNINYTHENTPEHENAHDEMVGRVRKAISMLPEAQRQALTLVDLEGYSYIEVAEAVEIPIGTVMSRLSRARNALKLRLIKSDLARDTSAAMIRRVK